MPADFVVTRELCVAVIVRTCWPQACQQCQLRRWIVLVCLQTRIDCNCGEGTSIPLVIKVTRQYQPIDYTITYLDYLLSQLSGTAAGSYLSLPYVILADHATKPYDLIDTRLKSLYMPLMG